ncbi:dTDP-4-dehydrorhamnose reductase [Akkermansia sp. N21169]|uniref:dTDP-4-dehydrorhamnose reductase n=1 Tax=Akkermansia sp. N21169 TaxID=3040765 RepID=UPI00244EE836|nr:dTDP-4-dehydrorhamnose reductase [Akkermansia sp. N21169]MDH3069565.1 dTDP-4-dehydrorhamnose reductase [Akkermansia sp. N21169]
MKILVTGANGQLGNEMKRISRENPNGNEYVLTDINELDITQLNQIRHFITQHHIEAIVNCAAYTNVDRAEDDEALADLINRQAVENLALAAREQNALLIHISTDYVFGGHSNTPFGEDAPTNPLGVYGRTKLAGEQAIQQSGCRHIIIRTAWLYSIHGNNFVKTMRRLMAERDHLNVVFDQVGTPTYAGDLADAIAHILSSPVSSAHEGIYHYTNEGVCSWYDFAVAIAELSGLSCSIHPCHSNEFPCKVERPSFSVLDKAKIRNNFSLTIPYWRHSLSSCISQLNNIATVQ